MVGVGVWEVRERAREGGGVKESGITRLANCIVTTVCACQRC